MTAEIAIINRQGIALAADSAVTVGRERVWKTANKLFSLSPYNDIGIMIYGSGNFSGYPWETVIKSFRQKIGTKRFLTVDECSSALLDFLKSSALPDRGDDAEGVIMFFAEQLGIIETNIKKTEEGLEENQVKETLDYFKSQILGIPENLDLTYESFTELFGSMLLQIYKEIGVIGGVAISDTLASSLTSLIHELFRRKIRSDYSSGLVVAGFGENEFFPCLNHYDITCRFRNQLRFWQQENGHNLNVGGEQTTATIIPFAQSDMFKLFMEGISEDHVRYVNKLLEFFLNKKSENTVTRLTQDATEQAAEMEKQREENQKILGLFHGEFSKFRQEHMTHPVMQRVENLPKEEMAALAEALIELTSLRRKMDSNLESVGGPTDVAIISKGDGLIWIKRKHYFEIGLNTDFTARKKIQLQQMEG